MGRHSATETARAPRQADTFVIGERRAALGRTRDAATPEVTDSLRRESTPAPVAAAPNPTVVAPIVEAPGAAPTAAADVAPAKTRVRRVTRASRPVPSAAPARTTTAFIRRRATVPALSFFAVFGFVGGSLVNPLGGAQVAQAAVIAAPAATGSVQSYTAHGTYADVDSTRDGYDITKPAPVVVKKTTTESTTSTSSSTSSSSSSSTVTAPAAGTPDPGSAQAIAKEMVTARGWGDDQYNCLVSLWNKESGWNVYAYNPSGAYGIPQALPGSKMSTAGADWQTNPATQITWGLNYITGSYGTPCGAWGHSQSYNWY